MSKKVKWEKSAEVIVGIIPEGPNNFIVLVHYGLSECKLELEEQG